MTKYVLSIDQSTSGTKVLVVDHRGEVRLQRAKPHRQIYPQAGWVEHDPNEIYDNVKWLLNQVIQEGMYSIEDFAVLAITNQRETVVVWDKETGEPIHNAVVWQCRRSTNICQAYTEQGHERTVQAKTGLTIDPYFSATKVKWMLDHIEGARAKAEAGKLLMGTIDSWLIWKLTAGKVHATDYTNASRTMLFNIHTLQWDDELLDLFRIPSTMLAEVKGSDALFGRIEDPDIPLLGLPISGIIGDSQGALFGQRCLSVGATKMTYGTGTSIMVHTDKMINSGNGLVTSIAWGQGGKVNYALEGILNTTGDVIKWLKEDVELIRDMNEVEAVAASAKDNDGVYLVPALVGLSAPYWSPDTRAAIIGMNRNTKRAHIIRAALESIAYQVKDIIELIHDEAGVEIESLNADGGATKNDLLMQFQADILNETIKVSKVSELSAMGSVYLAGLGIGLWQSIDEILALKQERQCYVPKMSEALRNKNYEGWKQAVARVLE